MTDQPSRPAPAAPVEGPRAQCQPWCGTDSLRGVPPTAEGWGWYDRLFCSAKCRDAYRDARDSAPAASPVREPPPAEPMWEASIDGAEPWKEMPRSTALTYLHCRPKPTTTTPVPPELCTHPSITVEGKCATCGHHGWLAFPVEFARRLAEIDRAAAAPAAPVREPKCRIYDAECISPAECQLDDDSAPCRVGDQLAFVEACKAPVGTVEHRWSDKCPWTTFHPDQASLLAPRSLALSQFRRKPAPPAPKPGRRSVGESRDISTPREIVHRAFKTATSRAGVSPFCCMPDGKHPCGVLCDTLTAAVEEDRAAAAREAIACVKRISAANDCWTADEILDAARLELLGEGEVKRG